LQKEEYFSLLKRQKIPSLEGTKKSLVSIEVFPVSERFGKKKYRNFVNIFFSAANLCSRG
jgi:hypothetical protein